MIDGMKLEVRLTPGGDADRFLRIRQDLGRSWIVQVIHGPIERDAQSFESAAAAIVHAAEVVQFYRGRAPRDTEPERSSEAAVAALARVLSDIPGRRFSSVLEAEAVARRILDLIRGRP